MNIYTIHFANPYAGRCWFLCKAASVGSALDALGKYDNKPELSAIFKDGKLVEYFKPKTVSQSIEKAKPEPVDEVRLAKAAMDEIIKGGSIHNNAITVPAHVYDAFKKKCNVFGLKCQIFYRGYEVLSEIPQLRRIEPVIAKAKSQFYLSEKATSLI